MVYEPVPVKVKTQCVFLCALLRYQYLLSVKNWIEYWPTAEECQSEEHRPICVGMEELVQLYTYFGCQHQYKGALGHSERMGLRQVYDSTALMPTILMSHCW